MTRKISLICLLLTLLSFSDSKVSAQSQEVQQLLLNVEKLAQLKQILQNMKNGFQVIEQGYSHIRNLSKSNFDLHKDFLDKLLNVSSVVKNYKNVWMILNLQQSVIKEYNKASREFSRSQMFNPNELQHISQVHQQLLNQSVKSLEELTMVITNGKLRMDDAERLTAIDRIYADMQDKLAFLKSYDNSNRLLAVGRKSEKYDLEHSRKIYGIQH